MFEVALVSALCLQSFVTNIYDNKSFQMVKVESTIIIFHKRLSVRLATWRLYHVMTGEPGPPMTMITSTHLWLSLWSTTQTGTIAQRKQPVSRNCRTCRTSIWTIKVYIINIINQICIHGHLFYLSCGWWLFFFLKKLVVWGENGS